MEKVFSGKQVDKAGEIIRNIEVPAESEDFQFSLDALSFWRYSHEEPLKIALKILRAESIVHDKDAVFARRLKRARSIFRKLFRYPEMSLRTMQDIGGCRAIFSTEKKLRKTVRELRKRKEFRNGGGKIRFKDYIKTLKTTDIEVIT